MATTKSKPKKKTKGKFSPWLIIVLVIILIAILSMGISYYLTNSENRSIREWVNNEEPIIDSDSTLTKTEQEINQKTPLEGIWVSYYDGAILTFTGLGFVLELPSVDSPEKINGKIAIESTIVTFYYSSGTKTCLDVEGHYQFSFDNDELNFKVIKDLCDSRTERMSANWFKL